MTDTQLSPRLRHLLIQEDRRTGKLILPDVTRSSPPRSPEYAASPLSAKPPLSSGGLPLPRAPPDDRRPSHLFSLLNDLSVVSPRSPPSSAGSGSISPRMARGPAPAPHIDTYAHHAPMSSTPLSAPLPGTRPHYFGDERRSTNGPVPPRPDLFRRHSSHPYEYNPASQPVAYRHVDYTPVGLGTSRAPISRTTKACNACRARKVRCDAGGNAGGEPSTCSRCRESGVPCVYSGAQKKRGPCPGTTRPTIAARRRSSQRGVPAIYEQSPTYHPYSSRSSYAYPSSPHAYPPPAHPYHQPPPVHRAGPSAPLTEWPAQARMYDSRPPSQPTPEPSPFDSAPLQRKHSQPQAVLSWPHNQTLLAAKHLDDRRISFDPEYSMRAAPAHPPAHAPAHASAHAPAAMSVSAAQIEEDRRASFFGDRGRQLPPLRLAIERRTSYYEP